ncbi:hypothetical protein RHSIM_Rhsim13G0116100 [Rhododendron simsii]|uniref:CCHC-type domain-containing protein n=1 Tax=Rhododendron simsii TaxID=118357 RepID=A0A834L8E7_RHOSS|nr:hypothetical protein RHSIM_Rhsim13G0116100 [Rhododendron simsii]
MEDVLYTKDLYLPIYGDTKKPQGTSDEDWKVTNRKAVALIRTWVDQSVFHHVAQETNAYELWTKLEAMYERKTAQNKASLIRRLVNLKYKDGRSVAEHMSDFQGLINQLSTMKLVLDEELQALLLLSSLPDSWETLVVTISNSAPSGMVTMDMVKDGMFNEEARRKEQGTSVDTEALVVQNRGRSRTRNSGGDRNKSKDRSRSKSRGTSKPRSEIECFHCHKMGHMRKECRILQKELKKGKVVESSGKKDTTAVASDGEVIIVCDDGFVGLTGQDLSWVIDSGASFHVTSQRDFFASYTHGDFGHVRMGNEGVSKIVGMGDVCLETNTGCKLLLKDVRHVPDIRLNLISAGKLDDEGYKNQFGDGKWKLSKGSLVVARGKKSSTLYLMQAKLSKGEVNAIGDEASTELWHKRLGHMSEKGMQILARKALLPEVKVDRKLVRSNDVVFFEDQTIEDLDKNEKPTPSHEYPVNLDPIPPPIVHDDYGGDVQNDDDVEETPAAAETEQEVQQEQVLSEPLEEEQLRRKSGDLSHSPFTAAVFPRDTERVPETQKRARVLLLCSSQDQTTVSSLILMRFWYVLHLVELYALIGADCEMPNTPAHILKSGAPFPGIPSGDHLDPRPMQIGLIDTRHHLLHEVLGRIEISPLPQTDGRRLALILYCRRPAVQNRLQ